MCGRFVPSPFVFAKKKFTIIIKGTSVLVNVYKAVYICLNGRLKSIWEEKKTANNFVDSTRNTPQRHACGEAARRARRNRREAEEKKGEEERKKNENIRENKTFYFDCMAMFLISNGSQWGSQNLSDGLPWFADQDHQILVRSPVVYGNMCTSTRVLFVVVALPRARPHSVANTHVRWGWLRSLISSRRK